MSTTVPDSYNGLLRFWWFCGAIMLLVDVTVNGGPVDGINICYAFSTIHVLAQKVSDFNQVARYVNTLHTMPASGASWERNQI